MAADRLTRGPLVLMLGAPGAGKTTWVLDRFRPTQRLSLDELRGRISDDEADQDATADAVRTLHVLLAARMSRGLPTVLDATNARRDTRADMLSHARRCGVYTAAVVLDVPFQECVERQAIRGRRVPTEVIGRIHAQVIASIPSLRSEVDAVRHITPDGESLSGWVPDTLRGAPWLT